MNKTYAIGLIALGLNSNYEMLMVGNDGLYSLPEMSVEALDKNNIVDCAIKLAKTLGLSIEQKSLAYVVEQKIPEENEVIVSYYFIVAVTGEEKVPKGYHWLTDVSGKFDKSIYPAKFVESIEQHLKNGWLMGDIEIIKE